MKIFISYSTANLSIVEGIAKRFEGQAEVVYWDKDNVPGESAWQTIFKWIDEATYVLAVITDTTLKRAIAVGQEIGYARKAGKMIVPAIAKGVKYNELGCLNGIAPIHIEADNMEQVGEKLMSSLVRNEEKQITTVPQASQSECGFFGFVVIVGIICFLGYLLSKE